MKNKSRVFTRSKPLKSRTLQGFARCFPDFFLHKFNSQKKAANSAKPAPEVENNHQNQKIRTSIEEEKQIFFQDQNQPNQAHSKALRDVFPDFSLHKLIHKKSVNSTKPAPDQQNSHQKHPIFYGNKLPKNTLLLHFSSIHKKR